MGVKIDASIEYKYKRIRFNPFKKKKMTKEIINQQIGQIEASIEKIEPHLNQEEFADYCDSAYTVVAYWKKQAKLCSDGS